ncbi:permease prefix domain 1-containing protein [Saccharothrix luteola]|uniref:permease prefix domain 1-containing protein n=1 Tax=Saccharothrix luteola TaxID=2893018 RepID=UPI001E2A08C6|nr:permease prefix domain 1-containing protein [Saccharothrix luteola]MCC8245303.1 permease prefix domain 1-containing protein [Saccharothrix luteola]
MAGSGVIDDYVTALDRRLRGPDPVKDDLLAEARDSLHDAAAAHRDRGLAEEDAQRRAVAEFGPVTAIAREYQGLLGLAYGARTLRSVMLVIPLAYVMWELNRRFWIGAWNDFDAPPPDWYLLIARFNDTSAWLVAGVAVLALLVGRRLARTTVSTVTLAKLAGVVAVVAVGVSLLGNVAILAATAYLDATRLLLSPPVAAATVVSFVIALRLAVLARRCVVFSSV